VHLKNNWGDLFRTRSFLLKGPWISLHTMYVVQINSTIGCHRYEGRVEGGGLVEFVLLLSLYV
jgi:hypothetical protein